MQMVSVAHVHTHSLSIDVIKESWPMVPSFPDQRNLLLKSCKYNASMEWEREKKMRLGCASGEGSAMLSVQAVLVRGAVSQTRTGSHPKGQRQ